MVPEPTTASATDRVASRINPLPGLVEKFAGPDAGLVEDAVNYMACSDPAWSGLVQSDPVRCLACRTANAVSTSVRRLRRGAGAASRGCLCVGVCGAVWLCVCGAVWVCVFVGLCGRGICGVCMGVVSVVCVCVCICGVWLWSLVDWFVWLDWRGICGNRTLVSAKTGSIWRGCVCTVGT